jgi:predicted amidohydrolase
MALAFGSVEIVAVQLRSVKDPDHNLNRMRQILDENVSGAVDLVVFPETSMTSFGTSGDAMVSQSQGLDGPFVAGLVHLAEHFDTHVSAGMFETNEAGLPFNTTVVVTAEGVVGRYRKVHLYDALGFHESSSIEAGSREDLAQAIVNIAGHKVGFMTCFDLRFPEVARVLALAGADVIALGAAWVEGPHKFDQWQTLLKARSIENGCYLVAAAQPGPRFCGGSCVVDPLGHILTRASDADEQTVASEISSELIAATRRGMPLLDLRRIT